MHWLRAVLFLIAGSVAFTGCCCRTTCVAIQPAEAKDVQKLPVQPPPKRTKKKRGFARPIRTPEPIPKPEPAPETPVVPEDQKSPSELPPKGELKRSPIETPQGELVIPFSEMCFSPEAEDDENAEEKTDWGFITPWLYKE